MDYRELIKKALLSKYSAVPPTLPPLNTLVAAKGVMDDMSTPEKQGPQLMNDPVPPPAAPLQLPEPEVTPSLPTSVSNAPAPEMALPAPKTAAPIPEQVQAPTGEYNDDARRALYDALAKKQQQGSIWSAVGALGDGVFQGQGIKSNAQENVNQSLAAQDKTAREEFELGAKAELSEQDRAQKIKEYLARRGDVSWDQDYKNRALQQQEELKRLAMQQAADAKAEARSTKDETKRDKYIQRHAETMQKGGIPELLNSYNEMAREFSSTSNAPGIGTAGGRLPSFLVSARGLRNRTTLQQIANTILKSRSGAAVSDQEYARFLEELAGGKLSDERGIRQHFGKIGSDLKMMMSQSETALPTDALAEYKSRAGSLGPENVVAYDPNAKPGAAPKAAQPATSPASSGPQPGEVKKGYRFKGGDPSKKENWEKA